MLNISTDTDTGIGIGATLHFIIPDLGLKHQNFNCYLTWALLFVEFLEVLVKWIQAL